MKLVALACLVVSLFHLGGCHISLYGKKTVDLHWQWAEGRTPNQTVVVRIDHLGPWGGGTLGIGKSPSLPDGFLDPMELGGEVLFHGAGWAATAVKLVLPAEELPEAHVGDRVALAIIAGDYNLCICAGKVPAEQSASSLPAWVSGWKCKTVGETIRERAEQK